MKALVVYYTRTGRTQAAARQVSEILKCDVEGIREGMSRKGLLGYLRSGIDGLLKRRSPIIPPRKDPSKYDLLILGTPLWAGRISSPARSYLAGFARSLPPTILLCTSSGTATKDVSSDFEAEAGNEPLDVHFVSEEEASDPRTIVGLRIFLDRVLERFSTGTMPA
ncbi:MAG: hypothetical protein QCI82_04650 [Candidatus Thermoplasmatota archaeon]|nr:hypothetical protein [Candidatus Thermoplasmatota archaeon]